MRSGSWAGEAANVENRAKRGVRILRMGAFRSVCLGFVQSARANVPFGRFGIFRQYDEILELESFLLKSWWLGFCRDVIWGSVARPEFRSELSDAAVILVAFD